MLDSGAKQATPCEDRQLRKINCTFAIALAKKFAWWAAMCYKGLVPNVQAPPFAPRLQLRNSASAPPQNQANCNAQKFAWWAAGCYAGLVAKVLTLSLFF